jgi:XapX domain-containing protein
MDLGLILKSLITGLVTGIIFSFFKLPIPAPTILAGVVGIFGIYLGYVVIQYLK